MDFVEGTCRCPHCGYPNFLSEERLFRAETDPVHCWHCEGFIDHHEVELQPITQNRFQHLAGQRVEMMAGGILYRGVFVEMTDEDVKIRGETGWIILEVDKVSRIAREGEIDRGRDRPLKLVDPSFYQWDDLEDPADDEDETGQRSGEDPTHD